MGMVADLRTAPGTAHSVTVTAWKRPSGGAWAATSLTCTMSDATTVASDAVHAVDYVAGDSMALAVTGSKIGGASGLTVTGGVF